MIIITCKRSNSHLTGFKKCFHDRGLAGDWIVLRQETLEEDGWLFEEPEGDDDNGLLKCHHPYETYTLTILWRVLHA